MCEEQQIWYLQVCYQADILKQTLRYQPTSTQLTDLSCSAFLHSDRYFMLFFATQCSTLQTINEIQFHLLANLLLQHVLHVSCAIDRQFKRTLTLIFLQTANPVLLIQHKGRGYLNPQTVGEMIHGGYMNFCNVIDETTIRWSGKIKSRDQYCLY